MEIHTEDSESLRRLFSSFARGWPGAGLLLMRGGAAFALLHQAVVKVRSGGPFEAVALAAVGAGAGMFLLAGLWTPIAAAVVAIIEFRNAFVESGDLWLYIVLAVLAVSLALLGPGAWSVDARLYGWKRIRIGGRDRQNQNPLP